MSVSAQTISAYTIRAEGLRRSCARALMIDDAGMSWSTFVDWLATQRPRWSRSTWRTYKRSVVETMKREPPDEDGDVVSALTTLVSASQSSALRKTHRTSASKAVRFPRDARERIFAALRLGRSNQAVELIDFISASCASGLRPAEWRGASLEPGVEDGAVRLVVQNAKATNGRAHGPTRTLHWRDLPPEVATAISRTIAIARRFPSDAAYRAYCNGLQDLLGSVSRRLWPDRERHFTLYTCRREFIARAKSIYSPVEVAALAGHSVDRTSLSHYGRTRKSRSSGQIDVELPTPDPGDVARVRVVAAARLAALSRLHERADAATPSIELEASGDATTIEAPTPDSFLEPMPKIEMQPGADLAREKQARKGGNSGIETPPPDRMEVAPEREIVTARQEDVSLTPDYAASATPAVVPQPTSNEEPTLDPFPEPPERIDEAKEARAEGDRLWRKFREEQSRSLDALSAKLERGSGGARDPRADDPVSDSSTETEPDHKTKSR